MLSLIQLRDAPPNRRGYCPNDIEEHLPEGAVILAFGLFLLANGASEVALHPDGEHGKRFDFAGHLQSHGFMRVRTSGKTSYGGVYSRSGKTLTLQCTPGLGDVVADIGHTRVVAECKGGVINTPHPGQTSRLRKGLCEAAGLLLARPREQERQIGVVPDTATTRALAKRMADRLLKAGIEIAVVNGRGAIEFPATAEQRAKVQVCNS